MNISASIRNISIAFVLLAMGLGATFYAATPKAQALESLATIAPGDLIRGQNFPAVYYMGADGFRYVFPTQKTYNTWYDNFNNVKFISDSDLAKIQIGGNVTYRPGVRMAKIDSDPKTYAVAKGGILRHVSSEAVAIELYGNDWNKQIDDIPDGFFTNYTYGDPITSGGQYNATNEKAASPTINSDKGLIAPAEINIGNNAFSPIDVVIPAGATIKFTNTGTTPHAVTADDLSWGSGTLQPGGQFIRQFKEPGVYPFFDSYNSQSTGAIYVE